jgi:hypothetical protein
VSFLVIAVLAVSVISKVRGRASLREFVAAVAQMRVVPARWAVPAATAAIVAEASVLALVAVPQTVQVGLGAATLLFGGFTAVLARAVSRGAQVGCHCFGASRTPVARRHVVRSGVLCAAALGGTLTLPSYPLTGIASPEILVAVVVAAIAATALVRLDDLFWLVRGGTRVS